LEVLLKCMSSIVSNRLSDDKNEAWYAEMKTAQEAGQLALATASKGSIVPDQATRVYWCALGNLYAAARTEVMRIGSSMSLGSELEVSPMLLNVRSLAGSLNILRHTQRGI